MGWTKLPINHKKSFTNLLESKFVFSLSASELGIRSDILSLPSGTVLQIQHSILFFSDVLSLVSVFFHVSIRRSHHLLLLNPVPAFLDTFTPDILHLLPSTFKPGNIALISMMIIFISTQIVINIVSGHTLPRH